MFKKKKEKGNYDIIDAVIKEQGDILDILKQQQNQINVLTESLTALKELCIKSLESQ